jgi:hypothetical protein
MATTPSNGDITEQEVISLISQGDYDIKGLVAAFRARIKSHPERAQQLKSIVLAVAQTKNGKLVLRKR